MTTTNDDRNLESYSIIWLDTSTKTEEKLAAQKQLCNIINQLHISIESDKTVGRVQSICQDNLTMLIISDHSSQSIMPKIQSIKELSSIYIYHLNKDMAEKWNQPFDKVCIDIFIDSYVYI